jgi:uncharacterized protein YacL
MGLWLIRVMFVIVFSVVGYEIGVNYRNPYLGGVLALVLSMFVVFVELVIKNLSLRGLSSTVFGLLLGLVMTRIVMWVMMLLPIEPAVLDSLNLILLLVFSYLGMIVGLRGQDDFHLVIPYVHFKKQQQYEDIILVDTSVIIDGRILDVIATGFIEAQLWVPQFVLAELQTLSDSQDPLKRQRGQRGLEILRKLQEDKTIELKVHKQDTEGPGGVDEKLVRLASLLDAKLMTTDFNLNNVASLQGVKVLNLNDLLRALKSVVMPGEGFMLKLIREGKEQNQAVGYLDDGTMVVCENAQRLIGKTVRVIVSTMLQSPSGTIVFTKLAEKGGR